jgi:NADP-dependent 3-hydroxy acid dehydrogenase YdfG
MSLVYKKVLVIGATSGIGREIARKVVEAGSSVIIVGRRKENLDEFVSQYGGDKVTAKAFDVTHLQQVCADRQENISGPELTN